MIIIAKNITDNIEVLNDVGISILPGQSINLIEQLSSLSNIIASKDIIDSITKERICINDGSVDLSYQCSLRYLYTGNLNISDVSGKLRVHATPRKLGLKTIWFGSGDDSDDPHDIGNGENIKIVHHIGDPLVQITYVEFNCIDNETYIHDAHLIWENAKFDEIQAEIVTRTTNIVPGTNTNYKLYAGYIIIPANGDGDISLVDDMSLHDSGLVYIPNNDLNEPPTAFWNATWDTTLKKYTNISPAPYGNGRYNMFPYEFTLAKFIHSICLLGNSSLRLGSYDSDALGQGMRLKLTGTTVGDDHEWGMTGIIAGYRKKTIYTSGIARSIDPIISEPISSSKIKSKSKIKPIPEPIPDPAPKTIKDYTYKLDEDGNFVLVK